jgi:hypothetical protein
VALSACLNARAASLGVPGIHVDPGFGVLYGAGSAPQLARAGVRRSPLLLPAPGDPAFSRWEVPLPKAGDARRVEAYWKGPGPVTCNCELGPLC